MRPHIGAKSSPVISTQVKNSSRDMMTNVEKLDISTLHNLFNFYLFQEITQRLWRTCMGAKSYQVISTQVENSWRYIISKLSTFLYDWSSLAPIGIGNIWTVDHTFDSTLNNLFNFHLFQEITWRLLRTHIKAKSYQTISTQV